MQYLETLFSQKSWANNELFNALASVSNHANSEAIEMAIRTLNHIFVVDQIFQAHLSGRQHDQTITHTQAATGLGQLHFSVAETDISVVPTRDLLTKFLHLSET
jgi:uncharacterized damage-inducible protein DinB